MHIQLHEVEMAHNSLSKMFSCFFERVHYICRSSLRANFHLNIKYHKSHNPDYRKENFSFLSYGRNSSIITTA